MATLEEKLAKIDTIIAAHKEAIRLNEELKRSLAHEAQDASGRPTVSYTKDKLERLRKAHMAAQKAHLAQFEFEGNEYVTQYAEYMVEYLSQKL